MSDDERAIRKLIEDWMTASKAGDLDKLLSLMAEDALFLVPGREFGRQAFAEAFDAMRNVDFEGSSDIQELTILGDWAWCRSHLRVAMKLPDGQTLGRAGSALTLFRKAKDGRWLLARDANLLAAE